MSIGQRIAQPLVLADIRHHVERVIGWKPTSFESVLVVGVGVRLGGRTYAEGQAFPAAQPIAA